MVMKKLCPVLCLLAMLCACDNSSDCPGPTPVNYQMETPYFIGQYVDGQIGLSLIKQTLPLYAGQRLDDHGVRLEIVDPVYYQDPFFEVATNAGYFLWAAERFGDWNEAYFSTSYDLHIGTTALYFEIESIEVTSDKDWDAAHPAGTSLNDLIEFRVFSYADYIDGGYTGSVGDWETKTLSEMTTDDFKLIKPGIEFYFKHNPEVIDQHRLTFRFQLGYTLPQEQTITIDCIPTKDE